VYREGNIRFLGFETCRNLFKRLQRTFSSPLARSPVETPLKSLVYLRRGGETGGHVRRRTAKLHGGCVGQHHADLHGSPDHPGCQTMLREPHLPRHVTATRTGAVAKLLAKLRSPTNANTFAGKSSRSSFRRFPPSRPRARMHDIFRVARYKTVRRRGRCRGGIREKSICG